MKADEGEDEFLVQDTHCNKLGLHSLCEQQDIHKTLIWTMDQNL